MASLLTGVMDSAALGLFGGASEDGGGDGGRSSRRSTRLSTLDTAMIRERMRTNSVDSSGTARRGWVCVCVLGLGWMVFQTMGDVVRYLLLIPPPHHPLAPLPTHPGAVGGWSVDDGSGIELGSMRRGRAFSVALSELNELS